MRFSLLYLENAHAYFEDRSKLFEFPQRAVDFFFLMLRPGIKMNIDPEINFSDGKFKQH